MSLLHAWSERFDEAASEARRAVELAPGSADVAHFASFVLTMCDHGEEAVTLAEKAIALSPNYPAAYIGVLGDAYRHAHRIEEAIAAFKEYGARSPGFGLVDLVLVYQQNGRHAEAREAAKGAIQTDAGCVRFD